ncbi:MAG: (2Fe-2S) ferredoxin domain-containing protein [Clostridiales bacterium]|jgi:NADP-reducing hydrogenase subunit HndB|nr:(2Fe-2S) ferredoxin domain-containing protein [Clostridiales bacterium]
MKSIEELKAIKARMQSEINIRGANGDADTRIVVGMATCGIAAGARPVLNAFLEEIQSKRIKGVRVTQAGCLGMCKLEPMVEVFVPGKEKVTYVKITPEKVKKIVADHIVNGKIVSEYVITENAQ